MKEDLKLPCEQCIVFAVCNSRARSLRMVMNKAGIIFTLYNECPILNKAFKDIEVPIGTPYRSHPLGVQMIKLYDMYVF